MEAKLDLPFDAEEMLAGLRTWVECESPTHDAAAVNRMMALAARHLAIMGASVETIPGRMGLGDCVRARFPHKSNEPGILVLAHLDTVHPVGTLQNGLAFRRVAGTDGFQKALTQHDPTPLRAAACDRCLGDQRTRPLDP